MATKSLSKKEFLGTLETCVDDHKENMQYTDEDEFEWRSKCIGVLEYAIKELGNTLQDETQIVIGCPDSYESIA